MAARFVGKIVTRDETGRAVSGDHKKIDEARDEAPRSAVALDHTPHTAL
jgi:hypothetical protein